MKHDWEIIGINELEKLAIEWAAFDLQNEYSPAIIKLIAAYREAVAALDINTELFDQYDSCHKLSITEPARKRARDALDTAKRLGVESK